MGLIIYGFYIDRALLYVAAILLKVVPLSQKLNTGLTVTSAASHLLGQLSPVSSYIMIASMRTWIASTMRDGYRLLYSRSTRSNAASLGRR